MIISKDTNYLWKGHCPNKCLVYTLSVKEL